MSIRFLHCGDSEDNLSLCVSNKVVGFKQNYKYLIGDIVYFAIRTNNITYCVARAVLEEETIIKPWANPILYKYCYSLKGIEYCTPFNLSVITSNFSAWSANHLRVPKPIEDLTILEKLETEFFQNINSSFYLLVNIEDSINEILISGDKKKTAQNVKIFGTFSVENFIGERDKKGEEGLETLVNRWFYDLFEDYQESNTLLIEEGYFKTSNKDNKNNKIKGTSTIPDALMLRFSEDSEYPLQINMIEYECYGNSTTREKFNKLTTHIIPQLIRFCSAFSKVSDSGIRDDNIVTYMGIIDDYIEKRSIDKVYGWIRKLQPDIDTRREGQLFTTKLLEAFNNNIQIILVIDEITQEERDTIGNMIKSFKLENENCINFSAYVVKLQKVVKLNLEDKDSNYALSVQK